VTTTDTPDLIDVTARGVPIRVVAVKWPGHWIIRGIFCFKSIEEVEAKVRPFVAIVPPEELEWTSHSYAFPAYLAYGTGDLPRIGWPGGGVFLFAHQGGDVYRGDARRLDADAH
jgi:hypothetical protein